MAKKSAKKSASKKPVAKKSAGRSCSFTIGFPERSMGSAVVTVADLIAAGDQYGCLLLISAATSARCGADMDVPDSKFRFGKVPRRARAGISGDVTKG